MITAEFVSSFGTLAAKSQKQDISTEPHTWTSSIVYWYQDKDT